MLPSPVKQDAVVNNSAGGTEDFLCRLKHALKAVFFRTLPPEFPQPLGMRTLPVRMSQG